MRAEVQGVKLQEKTRPARLFRLWIKGENSTHSQLGPDRLPLLKVYPQLSSRRTGRRKGTGGARAQAAQGHTRRKA
jgi:hypothetical protein